MDLKREMMRQYDKKITKARMIDWAIRLSTAGLTVLFGVLQLAVPAVIMTVAMIAGTAIGGKLVTSAELDKVIKANSIEKEELNEEIAKANSKEFIGEKEENKIKPVEIYKDTEETKEDGSSKVQ